MFVIRVSRFAVVFLIAGKLCVFASDDSRFNLLDECWEEFERRFGELVDEACRYREEVEESHERSTRFVAALRGIARRVIERGLRSTRVVADGIRSAVHAVGLNAGRALGVSRGFASATRDDANTLRGYWGLEQTPKLNAMST